MSATITERTIGTDQVLVLGDRVLVASKSEPGHWYDCSSGDCDCKGYQYRNQCRHIVVAAEALKSQPEPKPVCTPLVPRRSPVPTGKAALLIGALD